MHGRMRSLALVIFLSLMVLQGIHPARAVGGPCGSYSNQIVAASYTVPAGEAKVFTEDTVISAASVDIQGLVTTAVADAATGGDAPSLCFVANNLSVGPTATICTGNGTPGASMVAELVASGGDGGSGGDLIVDFASGGFAGPQALSIGAGAVLCTGDGGHGGEGIGHQPCDAVAYLVAAMQQDQLESCGVAFDSDLCQTGQRNAMNLPDFSNLDLCGLPICLPSDVNELTVAVADDCKLDSTVGTPEPPVCQSESSVLATGGNGGDGGRLGLYLNSGGFPSFTVPTGAIRLGKGGAGGHAAATGNSFGGIQATSGEGGASVQMGSGILLLGSGTPGWYHGPTSWFAAGSGGDAGHAFALPFEGCFDPNVDGCPGNLLASGLAGIPDAAVYCVLHKAGILLSAATNATCEDLFAEPCFGAPGAASKKTSPPDGKGSRGDDGDAAVSGWDFGISCGIAVPPCTPDVSCDIAAAKDAEGGEDGEDWTHIPSLAHSQGKEGGRGLLLGGRGGDAHASGGKGGTGGDGGKGGDGKFDCSGLSRPPALGGAGGTGGRGGDARAEGGEGGESSVQGGQGGSAYATSGDGGLGGSGGPGGNGGRRCDPQALSCVSQPGAAGGGGGFGNGPGTAQALRGPGGQGALPGPPGNHERSTIGDDYSGVKAPDGSAGT
jgi:hypothetical protein